MPRNRPTHATLFDFRDLDLMHRLAELNGGATSVDFADLLGFDAEEGARPVGSRLAWMRSYGMVQFDDKDRTWSLSKAGRRVIDASALAPKLAVIDQLPDETMIEAMAHVTSRFHRGESMLGHMLRREFQFGTGLRR